MLRAKVYVTASDDAPGDLPASHATDPPAFSHVSRPARSLSRSWRRFTRTVFRPLTRSYKRLSWITRQSVGVAVSFSAVLYVFLTAPFRLGFLYDPLQAPDAHRWTPELSVFVGLDAVVDVIGLFEFASFYSEWKDEYSRLSASVSFEMGKKLARDATRLQAPKRANITGLRQGKTKWTLATIGRASAMPADDASALQQSYMLTRNWELVLEMVALVPLELLPYASGAFNTLHLVRFTKLCRIYRLRHCFTRIAKIYSDRAWVQLLSSTGVNSLVRNIGLCAGMCHWVACGYMFLAHAQCGVSLAACDPSIESSWVIRDQLTGASVARKYGRTLYWASRTMVLLGYDDVTPVSNAETLYAVVVQLVGALFSSSLLATFLFIFRHRNSRYAAYSAHVDNAREYMHSQNIPRVVRHQVIAYFSYLWNTHHSLDSEEALHLMPKHLQSKVIATLKASRVKQVCFLMKESIEFINLLALALARRVYSPADQIIEPKINAQMFFIIRGKVVLSTFNGSNPTECQTGDFFADSCLLFPEKYEEKAIAKTFCELYVLAKTKFDEVLTHFYRGSEVAVRAQMTQTLEKYSTQLRKTKDLLGLRGGNEGDVRKKSGLDLMSDGPSSLEARGGVVWRMPGSLFRVRWDTVRLLAIIYVAFEVPYYAVFILMSGQEHMLVAQPEFDTRYALTLLVEVFFGVDIILHAHYLAYLDPIAMLNVTDPGLIFAAYRANGLFLDLFAWLPVGLVLESLSGASQSYSWFFRMLRLLRMRFIPELLQELSDFYGVSSKLHLVVSLLLGVTLMLHFVGCAWFEMAWLPLETQSAGGDIAAMQDLTRAVCLRQATQFQNCSWVKFDCYANVGAIFPAEDAASEYQGSFAYLRAVYWAVVTLTAVGYGDIVAFSTAESYFAALWIFAGGIINFGVVGAMSSTIANVLAPRHHHIERLNTVNSIMERMAISEKLSAEIRRFYHHHFTGRKEAYESQLLSNLPDQLCYQISSLLHSDAVKSVALFDSASIEFLQEVTGKFRHRSYQNGEAIYLQGDICREFLVLLHGSKVNVFFHSRKVPVRALHEGDCYGVNEFLAKRAHSVTLMAASPIHASVMTREQFEIIQLKFADDLRDMKTEAQALWAEEQTMLRRVVLNLEKLKLQPLMMHTPSLFYQRESAVAMVGGSSGVAGRQASRDVYATRTTFANVWNAGVTFWNVYNAFFVIFRIGFHSHLHFSSAVNTAVWVADLSCDLYFALDIYLRLYYFGCSEVGFHNLVERKEADLRYRRGSTFKWDLLASLPLYVPAASGSLVVSLCRLPRLVRCVDLWVYLDDVIVQVQQHFASRHVSAYLGPIKLMIVLVLVAHCVGCVFVWISELECEHNEQCWLNHDHLLHEYDHAMPILYAKTFYWAITTLLLVGSREIVPRGTAGTLWTAFTCLGCTFVMGHIVGEISELILELGKETKEFKNRIASFESFAKEHALPETLRARVGFFFRVQFEHTEGHGLHHVVHDLSANLRLQLMLEIYGQPIASLPISHLLTSSQINHLALRLQSELFIPGDNILVEGTFANRLCILRKGLAAVFWTKSVASVALLMEGALFGEVAFFLPDQRRLATVRATASCEVLHVSKHDWQELWTDSGDSSDSQVQKHALHAVLDWVYYRLQRYQQSCLRTASKAKRMLAVRHDAAANLHIVTTTVTAAAKTKAKLLAAPLLHYDPASHATVTPTPTQAELLTQPRTIVNAGSFVSPELQALEIKAKYLLLKTDACVKRFHPAIEELGKRPSSGSAVESMARSLRLNDSLRKSGRGSNSGVWRSTQGRTFTPLVERASHKSADIRLRQFIVDLSPVNKHVCSSLSDETVRHLESESWERFRRMAAMQHVVAELQDAVIPPENDFLRLNAAQTVSPAVAQKIQPARYKTSHVQRSQSVWVSDCASRNSKIQLFRMTPPVNSQYPIKPNTALKMPRMFVAAAVRGGHLSTDRGQAQDRRHIVSEQVSTLRRMRRCRSLPLFERDFFERARSDEDSSTETNKRHTRGGDIDFEVLQRCQRPQYSTQLRLYRRYRRWKDRDQPVKTRHHEGINKVKVMPPAHRRLLQLGTFRRRSRQSDNRSTPLAARLQLPSRRTLVAVTSEIETNEFIRFVKKLGKAWELLMLVAAVYNLVVTPFKVCFSHDLSELDGGFLRGWAGLEVLLDVLCLLDVGYRVRYASLMHHSAAAASAGSSQDGLRHVFAADPSLRTDFLAILPLELLLLATDVRVPLAYAPSTVAAANWALWTTRWLLRLNRLLFAWRIGPLSEELLQYAIYDLKLQLSEALVGFLRALASYLTMGHLLACLWFATSELGMHYYGVSWLSTSGMLTYIAPVVATTHGEEAGRALSEAASSAGFLESVALARKYLRSLYFSMECITTLFYGDILSMNPLELVVEIVITFWSIYIYGALVGAQGELLDSRARCEASFEQGLAELQHYLVQNEVPKSLKRQIKAYYAHMWQRGRGADDFAALAGVSRALYEDVVLATLRAFAGRVEAFRALDPPFLRALLVCLQYVVCSEGEQVVTAGDVDRSMYFIAQGSVVVKFDKVETTRERGEFFGELALLYGIARLQTCVALTVAQLYRLDHEPYERLLLDFPEYRARNKLAWATAGSKAPGRAIMTHGVERTAPRDVEPYPVESALISDSTTAEHATDVADYIEAELPHSYIYRSTMAMLAQLNRLDPLEAKDLILKCRGGASRRLRMQFGIASSGGEAANENS